LLQISPENIGVPIALIYRNAYTSFHQHTTPHPLIVERVMAKQQTAKRYCRMWSNVWQRVCLYEWVPLIGWHIRGDDDEFQSATDAAGPQDKSV
jgi:hypothetical protein